MKMLELFVFVVLLHSLDVTSGNKRTIHSVKKICPGVKMLSVDLGIFLLGIFYTNGVNEINSFSK